MKKILLFLSFLLMSIGMWSANTELTFSFTSNPGGWPTESNAGNYTYTIGTTNYTFALGTNVYYNSSHYLMLKSTTSLGLPAISNKKLTKIVVTNSSGCSTSTRVGISSSNSSASYITGGAYQTYSSTSSTYTYNLSGTSNNTMYYLYITNKNCQITQIVLTYTDSSPSYTITAQSNNTTYGTVSLSGSVITGSPKSCCQYASSAYTVTSGSATVSQSGNAFTVTPTSNCTVQINFEAKPKYTISFNNAAGTNPSSIQQSTCDESITLPTSTQISDACSEMGWTFAGWTTKSSGELTQSDLVEDNYTPTSNITLYAVFKKNDGGDGWSKLTSNTLTNGMNIVIVAPNDGKALYQETVSNSYGKYWNFDENDIDDDTKNYVTLSNSEEDGEWYLGDNTNGWLYNSSSNDLKFDETNKSSWEITYSNNKFSLTTNSRCLSCRDDLSGDNQYRFRMAGTACNLGEHDFDIYAKTGSTEYSFNPVCETVHVDTVTLPVNTIRIHVGETYELAPTISPTNATNKNVSWVSTMPGIATIVDGVVTGVSEGTAAAIVVTEDGSKSAVCVVIVLGNPNIDIVEWNPDWLKIDIENFTAATATLEDQNTQAEVKENIATKLFFSKYFEAAANIKLWAIYNGTKDTIPLTNVKVLVSSNGNTWDNSDAQKYTPLDTLGRIKKGYICPNEEIIVYNDGDKTGQSAEIDTAVMNCVKEKYNISNWYLIKNNTTAFSGDDGLMLLDGTDTLDIIGIMEPDYFTVGGKNHSIGTVNNPHGDSYGWCCENGKTVNGDSTALSTNRCLLIRKSTVHSGDTAVKYNRTNFVTLCSEWVGEVVEKHEGDKPKDAEVTCNNFSYVGTFDYNDYYVAYDTIYEEKPIPGQEEDGFYKIVIPELDTLSCTNLKITVKDASSNVLEEVVKIPIMIKTDATTTDATYFNKKNCDECDVVVLKNKILTVAGTTSANRDMKLYEGAELRVPTSTSYTLNSLALRRENDTVSSLYLNGGTLTVTNKVYFDLYITSEDWHYISLPGDFSLANVKFTNGKTPEHRKDYWARHYDGYLRSRNLTGGWQAANIDSTFSAGQGFIFGLDDRHKKKEFRFEFNNSILTSETSNKTIPNLYSWGCGDESLRPNHKGWNLIGNPYLGFFNAEIYDKIRVDSLVKVMENGHWTGLWELSNDSKAKTLRYAVIPSDAPEDRDAGGYKSVLLDDMKLSPFICFFVQIGGNDESAKAITMSAARKTNKIVARNYQEDEDDELFLRVKVDDWKTGCFISKNFSDKYEPGDDLESRYPIYQSIGGYNLLYSAINDSIIEHGVQVTAPAGNLYLDPKVDISKFEYIYANYNDNWFDLMHGETIDIEAGLFTLQAKRRVKDNMTTDIDAITKTNNIEKFIYNNDLYIKKNNHIYNVLGGQIR